MCAEHFASVFAHVVGIVLHERHAAGQTIGHDLKRAHERGRFPIALGGEPVALGHQPLHRHAGQLAQPVQIFKCGGKALEAAFLQKHAQTEFDFRALAQRFMPRAALAQFGRDVV